MTATEAYDAMRHFADSWGLVAMGAAFVAFAAWPFRPQSREHNEAAARMIFREDDNG